ncbi:ESPR-type extended signal peptide-containing protein [Megasphaera massiliensis]|uniref:ESPR-type extended signal peptide-containing protein n=5 Tax=Megasphaera TaxID=906 RepID=UPI0021E5DAC8|nr:ESPR-type extended signal peptide-containing protein [Megasphaera massiliensis]
MNRQYKVIWSKVKHCYIVVSELVKRNGKSSSVKSKSGQKIGVTLAVLALCFGLNGSSLAADMTEDQKTVYDAVIAEFNSRFSDLESRTDALVRETANIPKFGESDGGIAIGEEAIATPVSNIAIGYKANAGTEYSSHIAIGSLSEALGGQSIAIGNGARANTGFTIAIGHNADVARDDGESSDSIGIGTNLVNRGMRTILIGGENGSQSEPITSNFAVGIGYHAIPGDTGVAIGEWSSSGLWGNSMGAGANAKGDKSQAIGFQAYASHEGAVALGHKSFAMGDNAVAIGHQSYAVNKEEIVESYLSDEHIYPVDGVVSVSNPEYQLGDDYIGERHRRITNMAGGVDDYDAANVKQLKALKREIDDVDKKVTAGGSSTKYVSFNSSEEGNKANDGATGGNAMAVGPNAQATGDGSTAVGWNAEATGIGHSAAYGANAKALGEGSLAVGPAAEAYGKSGLAIGNGAISNTETLNESSIAIGDRTEVKSSGSIGMGIKSIASGKRSMAMGIQTQATGDYSIALGGYTSASGADSIALGHNAVAVADSSVAIGAKSVADRGYDTYGYTVDHATFTSDAELLTYLGKIDEYNTAVDTIAAHKKEYDEKYAAWRADRGNEELRVAAEEAEAKLTASKQALLKLTAAYKSYFGAASVGTDFATRQITGVAAGSEDTDAVNVAQLKALNTKVDDNKLHYIAIGPDNEKNLAIGGNYNNDGADMHWGIAIGVDASSKDAGIAMGKDSRAHGEQSVSLGSLSSAIGSFTTAVGHSAQAYGDSATAYGAVARAYGASGVAIGDSALVASSKPLSKEEFEALPEEEKALYQQGVTSTQKKFYQYKQKNQSGEIKDLIVNGVAVGVAAQSIGVGGVAIGDRAKASDINDIENSNWGVALGAYSQNKVDQGVALGTNSVSDRAKNVKGYLPTKDGLVEDFEEAMAVMGKTAEFEQFKTDYTAATEKMEQAKAAYEANQTDANLKLAYETAKQDVDKLTSKFAVMTAPWVSRKGAVSVGNDKTGQTRQIIGVAAGSEDTDAVNVAQLKALNTKVDANKIEYVSIKSSVEENKANDGATATDTVAIGPKASATYEGAVAIGRNVTANGGVAIGQNSSSTSEHSVAIGLGSVAGDSLQADVAIGNVAKAAGYSVAIGNGASAFMDPETEGGTGLAVAIGSSAVVSGQGGVAVGQGSKAVFQANAMGSLAKATGRGAVAIGDTTEATGVGAVSIGNRAETDNVMGIAIGTYTKGLGYGTIGIGGNAEATGNWSMAMGQSSVASAKLSTALGHYSNVTSEKSVAVGPYASAQNGSFATALGYSASTRAGSAVALGSYSAASGGASMALGYDSAANVNTGVALGAFSVADRGSKVYGYNVDSVGFASDEDIAAYLGKAETYQAATEDFEAKLAVYNEKKDALADDPDNEQLKAEYEEASKAAEASFDARNAIVSAYRSGLGAISIGTVAETRQITNVAAGSEDTDAVNVAQLKGLKTLLDTKTENLEDNSKGYFHANMKEATDPTWNNYGLMSDTGGAGGYYSVAAGVEAQVSKDAEKAVAIGYRTKTKQKGGIAVGYDTVSDGERAVAIGQDAVAKGVDATALGFNAQALNAQSLALGNQAKATGAWSIAIAQDTEASGHLSLAASYGAKTAGLQSVGIGVLAATSSAAENSVAIGTMAQALGVNTTAIGPTAKVRGSHSVGVGPAATTDSTAYNGTAIGKNAYIGAVRDSGSGVGVPSDGITQGNDTEPEAGKEHMNSTALGFAAKAFGFQNLSVGAGAETYDTNTIAIGVNAVAKDHYATALGKQARATGKNSTAIGHWATSVGEDSVSIGTLSTIQGLDGQTAVNKSATLGAYARAAIDNSVALGHESLAYVGDNVATKAYLTDEAFTKENGVVSVGNAEYTIGETTVEANRRRITNVAGGADAYDAVNVAQLQAVEAEGLNFKGDGDTVVHRNLGTELIISGGNTDSTTLTENNIGVVADKDSGSLSVKLSKNVNLDDGSVTFVETAKDAEGNVLVKGEDGNWYADLTDAVYDADAQSYTKNGEVLAAVANPVVGTVKLTSTGLDNGNQRITNVAAGVQATDAVNMSQLNDLNTKVDTNKIEYVSIKSSEIENKLNDGATGDNSIAIGPKTKVTAASAVATGYQSEISNSNFGSAYGATSKVTGSEQGTAIGYGALVDNSLFGTALGTRANVTNSIQGTAVGQSANVSGSAYGTSLGTFSKVTNSDSGIAIGSMANVNNANYGMAIGINSSVTNQGGTALGYGTSVTEKSGVALGLGAKANRSGEVYGYSPDGVTFTDEASIAAYLGKTAEFEQAHQDYVEKVQIFQEKLAAYQQEPRNPDVIQAYVDAANAMEESFEKRTGIIAAYKSSYGAVSVGGSGATRQIINVAAGTEDSDAVNLAQLKTVEKIAKAHTELTLDGKSATAGADGKLGDYIGDNNLTMAVKDVNGQKVYDLKLSNELVIGQPGKDGKDGKPGSIGLVGPQGPAGEDGQPGKNAYGEISVKNGADGVDGTNGKDGITRIVYVDENDKEHTVATLEDGLKFAGDTENVTIAKKLNETLDVKGGISEEGLLTDNNIGVVAQDKGGLTVKLAKNLNLSDGSVAFAETAKDKDGNALVKGEDGNWYTDLTDAVYDADSQTYTKDGAALTAVESPVVGAVKLSSTGLDNGNQRIVNVAAGINGMDAVNVDQLDAAISKVSSDVGGAHTELTLDGKSAKAGADGALGEYIGENNLTMAVKDVNGQKVYDLKLKNEVVIGQPGKDGKDGTPGSIGLVGPQGPAGEDGQPGKNAYGEISVKNGADGVDGTNGKDGMTRIVYVDENDKEHTVATLEDGLQFAGDTENVTIAKKLNETLDVKGGISDTSLLTDNNIGVVAQDKGGLTVKLAKNLNLSDGSVAFAETAKDKDGNALVKGEDGNWYTDLTDAVYDAATQTYTKDGAALTAVESPVVGVVKLSSTGLDNGNQRIVNVATGIDKTDAVNVGQLDTAISNVVTSVGGAHTELTLDGKSATAGANGALGEYIGENNLTMAVKDVNGQKVYDLKLKNEVVIGQPGKDGKDGKPGSIGLVGPAGPAGEDGQPGKNAYGEISVKNGVDGVDGKHGKDGITRIVYEDENGEEHTVATLEDGLKFAGDTKDVTIAKKLNETLEVKGGISEEGLLTDNNIGVVAKSDGGLTVKLAKDLQGLSSVRIGGTTGDDGTVTGGIYIANQKDVPTTKDGKTEDGLFVTGLTNTKWNPDANGIVSGRAATEDQLKAAVAKVESSVGGAHTELTLDGKSATAGADGALGDYIGENNLTMAVKDVNGQKVYDLKLKNEVVIGQPGKDGKDGTPGSIGLVGPQGPAGEDGQPGKNAYAEISVKNGVDGVDGKHGKDGITRIVYEDEKGEEHTVATLEDGLKFAGDTKDVTIPKKLNETLDVKGGISDASMLSDNNIGVVAKADGGLTVKLAKNLNLSDGSVTIAADSAKDADGNWLVKGEDGNWYNDLTDAVYDADSQTYTKDGAALTAVESPVVGAVKLSSTGLDNGNQRIVNVAAGINGMDAVNVDQLDAAISKVSSDVGGAHTELTLDGKSATAGVNGALGEYIGENNLTMAVKDVNGQKVYDLKLKNEVVIGQPGKDGKDGKPGSIGLVGPAGPAGEDGQPGKNAYAEISVKNGADGVDGTNGKDGMTRIVYVDENDKEHTVATLEDGLKFAGDTENVTIPKKLNETLDVKGGISDTSLLTDNNIGVVAQDKGGLTVKLAKNLNLSDGSVTIAADSSKDADGNWLVKGEDGNWYNDLTDAVYDEATQTYTKDGAALTAVESPVVGAVKLSSTGLDNGNQRIVNVAAGIDGTDAVNVAQLKKELSDVTASVGGAHTELTLDGKSATAGVNGALGEYIGENNLTMAVKDVNGQKVYDLKLKNEVVIGQPGKDGKDGTPGSIGLVGPQGPAGEDGQPGKNAYAEISVKNGVDGVDGKHGKDGITRIVYEDEKGEERVVATLDDGLKFAGDTKDVTIPKKLNETLEVKGGISDESLLTDNNIGVVAKADGGLNVKLAKNLNLSDGSVRIGGTTDENGVTTGGIYIANQKAVPTTKDGKTEDGLFITGLANTDWNPDMNGIVESRAATEKQLKTVADSSAKVDAANLSDNNVNSWKTKLGITDTLLGEAGAWKLTVNGTGERSIKKDSVINFVNGEKVQIAQSGNDITVGLDAEFVKQVGDNTTNITNLDKRVTKVEGDVTNVKKDITKINNDITNINNDITNINTKIETIEGKAGVANVVGDTETGVKVEKVDANDAAKGVKVSLEEKIKVGGITIDGKLPSEGETANRTITGLTNTTWDADHVVDDRAATEGQLKDLSQKIKEVGEIKDGVRTYASDDSGDNPLKRKNSDAMELRGGADSDNLSDDNIGVVTNSQKTGFDIKLSKDLKGLNSAEIGNVSISNNITVGTGDKKTVITDNSVTTGNTTINNDGLTIKNEDSSKNITIQTGNVNMGGNAIHNVGEATEANDAINKAQLDRTVTAIGAGMNEMSGRIGSLDRRVDRVGAGAAALAALHPLEYSPDAKWEVTAGLGNYRSTSAVALGAFYRPNYDTLFSIGASYGGGENMVNAGVTWRIGEGETKNYPSKQVMAQEIDTLKSALAQQNDKIESQSEQLEEQNKKIEQLMQAIENLTK